jgi:hypothetical protein
VEKESLNPFVQDIILESRIISENIFAEIFSPSCDLSYSLDSDLILFVNFVKDDVIV